MDAIGMYRVDRLVAFIKKNRRFLLDDYSGEVKPSLLRAYIGGKDSYWSDVLRKRNSFGARAARATEEKLDIPRMYLDGVEPSGEVAAQAHVVSLDIHTVSIPTLAWEKIVATEPTEPLFKVAIPDDSMSPLFLQKQWIIFSKTRTPKNGKLILVRDKHGQPHIRMRTQGDGPDEWIASAPNPAYRSFAGSEVTVIAAYQGQMEPDD